ncbi:hypothetical protein ACFQAT_25420 [Undibacterium arcticum]|uniref:hypothetical protein n=1 Tax=Undibacterium arcticum TaxID=1762892 RepID=UPI0036143806
MLPSRGWPGGHLLFFASPKKSKQKKGDRADLPFGCPFARRKKWEMSETRLRLKQRTFLIHFLRRANGSVSSGFYGKVKSKFKNTFNNRFNHPHYQLLVTKNSGKKR